MKKVIVIGAGPGGLSAAMILAHRGYDVVVYEKQPYVGGRTSALKIGDFTFELGPTFVMLPQAFDDIFEKAGRKISDYLDMKRLDTMYRLRFDDGRNFVVPFDKEKMKQEIARLFPGDEKGYERYLKDQKRKFDLMYPCLKVPYLHWYDYLRPKLLKAFPFMNNFTSVYDVMAKYFKYEDMRISMTFQAKYLGMSPWHCPGAFSILSYIEHAFGIFHPIGGVHKISEVMADVIKEDGGHIVLGKPVQEIIVEGGVAKGVRFEDGTTDMADFVIMNADFAAGMSKLLPESVRGKWTDEMLAKRPYSCSTFMLYIGLDKKYDIPHHNIFFAKDYKHNIEQIFDSKELPEDPSFYIQNASVTDSTLAPEGKSTIYVLVPVPNLDAPIDWSTKRQQYRDLILKMIREKTELKDIEEHIEVERIVTPSDWERDINVYKGAVFNLSHTLGQMLYLRPHNQFDEIAHMYLVGGGTHPGSGLPTIIESGRIAADLISQKK
ncbi:MAG: phytoene desaturase [Candidatus Parcubacteria bacterium]|jgi:phytoene desaturase